MKLDADTIKTLLELPPGKTDAIFFDEELKGFGLRLRGDGGRLRRSWIAQYRLKGRTRRAKIGDIERLNAKQAREAAAKMLARVTLGQDPQSDKEEARRVAGRTLRSVADEYLEMKKFEMEKGKYRPASYRVTKLYLSDKRYFGSLHSMTITDISLMDIATRLNAITRNSGSVTSGRARSALSSVFTWAMQQGLMGAHPHNPVIGTKKPEEGTSRDRVLENAELGAIWRACADDDFGKIVRLLILTACRREEIGGLRWSEIDLDAGTLTLPKERVKNKHEHTLPLTPLALSIFNSVPERIGPDHVFGNRSDVGFTRWDAAKDDLESRLAGKVTGWRLHDLRRTVATWMAEHGNVEPHIVEAVLNHYSGHRGGVAGVYNRSRYERQIRAALSTWDDHVRSLIEGGERKVLSFPQPAQENA